MKRGGPLPRRAALRRTPMRARTHRDPIPAEERDAVLARSDGRCELEDRLGRCENRATQMHHVLRRSQGGGHDRTNLLHLCAWHHEYVHTHPEWAYQRGYLRRSSSVRLIPEGAA